MARDALDALGRVQQPADGVVALVHALELFDLIQRAPDGVGVDGVDGDQLGHAVRQAVLHPEDAPTSRTAARAASVPNVTIWAT